MVYNEGDGIYVRFYIYDFKYSWRYHNSNVSNVLLMLQPCVMKWYSKQTIKTLESLANITNEETEDK